MQKKTRQNTAVAAAAVVASASVLVGGAVASPGELLDDAEPIELRLDNEDAAAEGGTAQEERRGVRARCRDWLLRLPLGVRATLVLPLWALGWLILSGAQLLWTALLSPLAGRLALWALLAALALGVFALGVKALFPDLPLKKILKRRSIFALLGGVCVLGAADALLPLLWEDYEGWREALGMAASCLLTLGVLCLFARRETKRRRNRQAAPPAETQEEALRRVLEMADSAK